MVLWSWTANSILVAASYRMVGTQGHTRPSYAAYNCRAASAWVRAAEDSSEPGVAVRDGDPLV